MFLTRSRGSRVVRMTWAIFVFFFSSLGTASGVIRALDLLCEKLLPLSICTVQSVIFVYSLPSRMRYRELILIIMQSLTPLFVLSLSLSSLASRRRCHSAFRGVLQAAAAASLN